MSTVRPGPEDRLSAGVRTWLDSPPNTFLNWGPGDQQRREKSRVGETGGWGVSAALKAC